MINPHSKGTKRNITKWGLLWILTIYIHLGWKKSSLFDGYGHFFTWIYYVFNLNLRIRIRILKCKSSRTPKSWPILENSLDFKNSEWFWNFPIDPVSLTYQKFTGKGPLRVLAWTAKATTRTIRADLNILTILIRLFSKLPYLSFILKDKETFVCRRILKLCQLIHNSVCWINLWWRAFDWVM